MVLIDVNILVYAYRTDSPDHAAVHRWLEETISSQSSFGLSERVLSGFLRIVTHPRIFDPPTPLEKALEFVETLRAQPNCVLIAPGPRHWAIFAALCRAADARGNLIPDAYLATMAIETGSEFISTDRDFSRFPGLRWRAPF